MNNKNNNDPSPTSHVAVTPSSCKFTHKFSGLSVWLEPDPSQTTSLMNEMEHLSQKCGGVEAGMHGFVPHCTLLYNTSLLPLDDDDGICDGKVDERQRRQEGEKLLRECIQAYQQQAYQEQQEQQHQHQQQQQQRTESRQRNINLTPTSHLYFPYPKSADEGRGFGCCISLLMLDCNDDLRGLFELVKRMFPRDERHGVTTTSEGDVDGSTNNNTMEVKFQPHMALVYAPENHENVMNGWLEEYTTQMEREKRCASWCRGVGSAVVESSNESTSWRAKYLSLWSTEGTIDEWCAIAKIDLEI